VVLEPEILAVVQVVVELVDSARMSSDKRLVVAPLPRQLYKLQ
jgi:hypothetical protein